MAETLFAGMECMRILTTRYEAGNNGPPTSRTTKAVRGRVNGPVDRQEESLYRTTASEQIVRSLAQKAKAREYLRLEPTVPNGDEGKLAKVGEKNNHQRDQRSKHMHDRGTHFKNLWCYLFSQMGDTPHCAKNNLGKQPSPSNN